MAEFVQGAINYWGGRLYNIHTELYTKLLVGWYVRKFSNARPKLKPSDGERLNREARRLATEHNAMATSTTPAQEDGCQTSSAHLAELFPPSKRETGAYGVAFVTPPDFQFC